MSQKHGDNAGHDYNAFKSQTGTQRIVTCANLPLVEGVLFRVETSVATAFKTNAISVIRGLNKQQNCFR